jgi:acyl-CoA thioesterase-1
MRLFVQKYAVTLALALTLPFHLITPTHAQTKIVAIGASNTSGFGVGSGAAYPAQLEAMLKARGYNVQVTNGGILGETTNGMLARIDSVPAGTRIVILQPGGNDARFGFSKEQRAKNIRAMVSRLQKRGIRVIVADNLQGLLAKNSFDGIHFNAAAHAAIAKKLYPQVAGALGGGQAVSNGAPASTGSVPPKHDEKSDAQPAAKQ